MNLSIGDPKATEIMICSLKERYFAQPRPIFVNYCNVIFWSPSRVAGLVTSFTTYLSDIKMEQ